MAARTSARFDPRFREGSDTPSSHPTRERQGGRDPRFGSGTKASAFSFTYCWAKVSTHAPAKGATHPIQPFRSLPMFRSTLPRRERLRRPALELLPDVVSMHAPVKERRGRQSRDTPATCFHLPYRRRKAGYRFSRMSVSVRAGVIASGSSLISMIAGLPLVRARSKAGAKASVVSTVSPWPPKARA